MSLGRYILCLIYIFGFTLCASAQSHGDHDHSGHDHSQHDHSGHDHSGHDHSGHSHAGHDHDSHGHGDHGCALYHESKEFNPTETSFHHIADANVYSIGPLQIPLPCILYAPKEGLSTFLSSKFNIVPGKHGSGDHAVKGYVLDAGTVKHVPDPKFPRETVHIDGFHHKTKMVDGKEKPETYVCYGGQEYKAELKSTLDGGMFGGGLTSFYDFSITKNVAAIILVFLFLSWLFIKVARAYRDREGKAPSGVQSFIEPMFVFIQDEVAKPFLGHKWERFTPFLMCLFFFILGLNLFGQIPFFGGANVTGNLSFTLVLAVIAFIVTNINGNGHYWQHIFNMPGVPGFVKLILTPVELLGIFIKPITLMLRLFANMTAGHMVIIIFVGLIFMFGDMGRSAGIGYATAIPAALLTLFMMTIELLVAFLQAFVFTILTASYIGAAVEEGHDDHH